MDLLTFIVVIAGVILFTIFALILSKKGPRSPSSKEKLFSAKHRESGDDELIKHWEFQADMRLSTPLSVLEHHGEIRYPGEKLPKYGDLLGGVWIPITKSWEELLGPRGARAAKKYFPGTSEEPSEYIWSDVGNIPRDGGRLSILS